MKFLTSNILKLAGPVLVLMSSSSIVTADARQSFPETYAATAQTLFGIQYAQASIDALNDSDLRRMNFYAGRTLDALAALAAEDALAGSDGAAISGDTVGDLRAAITRLIDAGKRSGLSQTDVADFFYGVVSERFTQDIPLALQDASGEIDTRSLFAGVVGRTNFAEEREVDVDYLAILNAESATVDLSSVTSEDEQEQPVPEAPDAGPQLREGADQATREIVDRVFVTDGIWKIEVVSGDTLARFASAIYGDALAYRQIYSANANILANANTLVIGQVLTVPKP